MEDSKQEIIEATCKALNRHGYSQLSIQKIADEFDKSKSLLYHHYDSKEEILLDFMDFMLEKYKRQLRDSDKDTREDFMEKAFMSFQECDGNRKAFVELRAEGLRDERFREKFQDFSEAYREKLAELIAKGREEDVFKQVEPESASALIDAMNKEAIFQKATRDDTSDLKSELEAYIEERIMK